MPIKYLDMFAGIGGFRSGLDLLGGFECIGSCEIDIYAKQAYDAIYPTEGELYFADARTIDPYTLPDIDLICGGFPCQSFSIAGLRRGFQDDTRGTLFFEIARIAAVKRPAFLLLENVPGLLSHDKGRTFATILSALDELGYDVAWQVLNSKDFGVPQTRKRVFLVGYLDPRCAGEILPIERKGGKALSELTDHQPQGKRVYDAGGAAITQTASCGGFGGRTGLYLVDYNENSKFTDTARCITARQDSGMSHHKGEHSAVFFEYDGVYPVINPDRETVRQNGPRFRPSGAPSYCLTVVDRHGIFHRGWIRKLHPQECFRLMGFSDEQFFKLKNELGLSDSKLYKLAGNSIMVPVLVDILSRLKAVNEKYQIIKE